MLNEIKEFTILRIQASLNYFIDDKKFVWLFYGFVNNSFFQMFIVLWMYNFGSKLNIGRNLTLKGGLPKSLLWLRS